MAGKRYTSEELQEILRLHALWLEKKGGQRADLKEADLRSADLKEADLMRADLSGSNLIGADLSDAKCDGATMIGADLCGANLIGATLVGADLRGSYLNDAILMEANLSDANLVEANLSDANGMNATMIGADLSRATMVGADLGTADLSRAIMIGADLGRADLSYAELGGADLSDANLGHANLTRTNMANVELSGVYLFDADLSDAILPDNFADLFPDIAAKVQSESEKTIEEKSCPLQLRFPKMYELLMKPFREGTETAKRKMRERLLFFRDVARMKPFNLTQYAIDMGWERKSGASLASYYFRQIQAALIKPLTQYIGYTNKLELTEAGQAFLDWIEAHPEYLPDSDEQMPLR